MIFYEGDRTLVRDRHSQHPEDDSVTKFFMGVHSQNGRAGSTIENYNGHRNSLTRTDPLHLEAFGGDNWDNYVLTTSGNLYRRTAKLSTADRDFLRRTPLNKRAQRILNENYEIVPQTFPVEQFPPLEGHVYDIDLHERPSIRRDNSIVGTIRNLSEVDLERMNNRRRRINMDLYGGRALPTEFLVDLHPDEFNEYKKAELERNEN